MMSGQAFRTPQMLSRAFRMRRPDTDLDLYDVERVEVWEYGSQPLDDPPKWDGAITRVQTIVEELDKFGAQALVAALTMEYAWAETKRGGRPK